MKILAVLGLAVLAISCEKIDMVDDANNNQPASFAMMTSDPVLELFSKYGSVERASEEYVGTSEYCSAPLGLYLFTPDNGPFAGKVCEIYRYKNPIDIEGPCGDEYNKKWEEYEFGGGISAIACPESGSDCEEVDGVNGCRLIHCDEA
jgi:hypothetical protein